MSAPLFNHAWALLVNLPGMARGPGAAPSGVFGVPGEAAIPAGYCVVTLPAPLVRLRSLLFGTAPDRAMLHYRTRQLLTLVHATEYAGYLTAVDARVTYNLGPGSDAPLMNDMLFRPQVTQTAGAPTATLDVLGTPEAPDRRGALYYEFGVTLLGATTQILAVAPDPGLAVLAAGPALPLAGTGYSVRASGPMGAAWTVAGYRRPQWELGALVAALDSFGTADLLALFGAAPDGPLRTFRNLWLDRVELPQRLAGLVLALIMQTDALRTREGLS